MYLLPIPSLVKRLVREALPASIWGRLKSAQRRAAFNGAGPYSFDEPVILKHVDGNSPASQFYVDIGAQDGVLGSQTLALAKRGWAGLAVEGDRQAYDEMARLYRALPDVQLVNAFVSPSSIVGMLRDHGVPDEFGFLSLDIDSFDFDLLEKILENFKPSVICVEINEVVPPPIYFAVPYAADAGWDGGAYQGFSIQAAKTLCNRFSYKPVELHYNNLILVREGGAIVSDEDIKDLYRRGYAERSDRDEIFPWNKEHSWMLTASPVDGMLGLKRLFGDRATSQILRIEAGCE